MFDFEKFPVYLLSEKFYSQVIVEILSRKDINSSVKDQLRRASMSIILNIAEGAGKYAKNDKRSYYTIARGSTNECVAILRIIKLEKKLEEYRYKQMYDNLVEIGKMLSGLIHAIMK